MPADLQTSFIPKAPITTRAPSRRSGIGVATLTSIVLLLVVAIVYGGLYAYGVWLTREIGTPTDACTLGTGERCSLQASIKRIKEKVRGELIAEIKQTGERIALAETLLAGRMQLTTIFTALEGLTLSSVQITDFSYKAGEPLHLKGLARGYEPVALQSDALNQSSMVHSLQVFDLTLNKNGTVSFSMDLTLVPEAVPAVSEPTSSEPTL